MDLRLQGRAAIVTGASRGLGAAAALALAAEGVDVLGVARSVDALEEVRRKAPARIRVLACDMRDEEQVAALPDRAIEAFGRLDIVVNNAGIAPAGRFTEQQRALWREILEVNVLAPAVLAQAAGRRFLEQGSGKVINVASTSGITGKPVLAMYSASKGALVQMTKALGAEWAKSGVQVNAIAPGAFATEAQSGVIASEELLARRLRKIPAGRMGDVDEIGPVVCLLASPLSDFMSGSIVVIDGGEVAKL